MQNGASRAKPDDERTFLSRVRPEDWKNPEPRSGYDLAIVGAGPAGLAAAESAARLGFSVVLIERNRLGGNSLNAGSVPSKAIIRSAHVYGDHAGGRRVWRVLSRTNRLSNLAR